MYAPERERRKAIYCYLRSLLVAKPDLKFSVSAFEEESITEESILDEPLGKKAAAVANLVFLSAPTELYSLPRPTESLVFKNQTSFEGMRFYDYHQSLFLAEYAHKTVFVKFCERDSEAQRIPVAAGLVPILPFCSTVVGEVFMMAIGLVDGRDGATHIISPKAAICSHLMNDVEIALEILSTRDSFSGDVTRPIIVVFRSQEKGCAGMTWSTG
jgi:hypothetical protein